MLPVLTLLNLLARARLPGLATLATLAMLAGTPLRVLAASPAPAVPQTPLAPREPENLVGKTIGPLVSGSTVNLGDGWPALPRPPQARLQWVADDLSYNGLPMRILRFTSTAQVGQVVSAALAHWRHGYAQPPAQATLNEATVVSQMHGPYLMTLKVAPLEGAAGSHGLLAVSRPGGTAPALDSASSQIPQPPGATLLSTVRSQDAGRMSHQSVLQVSGSVATTVRWYSAALSGRGWQRLQGTDGGDGHFAVYRRGDSELALAISAATQPRGGSLVVAQLSTDQVLR